MRFDPLRAALRRALGARSGQVSVIFALSLLPITALLGLCVDFGRASMVKIDLNAAADEAALAAVSASSNPQMSVPTQSQIQQYFSSVVGTLPTGSQYQVTSSAAPNVTSLLVTVNYTATIPTIFGALFGVPKMNLSGTASAAGQLPTYVNFYLLLDNSPSMGIGATAADIQNMENLTPDTCAFACHEHSFNSKGQITGDKMDDYYHLAKNNGVTTRIDVLRSASQTLMTTAEAAETVPNQFGMSLYTFSDTFQTLSSLSPNLTAVRNAAANIDLAYAYYNQRDAQTSYDTALSYINQTMPPGGTGASSTQPAEFLFLVTDGVEDEPVGKGSASGDPADTWSTGASGAPPNTKSNISNSLSGNVNSTRLVTTLSQSRCTAIKSKGVKIAILYTPYLPVTANAFYNQWVAPISNNIPTNLQNCASPGFFFQITPTQGISEAMQAMFNAALSEARLTN